jgi:hypothetical protein
MTLSRSPSRFCLLPSAFCLISSSVVVAALVTLPACQLRPPPFSAKLVVDAARPADTYIEIRGVDTRVLRTDADRARLQVFAVRSDGSVQSDAMVGNYTQVDYTVQFTPIYSFDPGRSYEVRYVADSSNGGSAKQQRVTMPSAPAKPATFVAHVYPSGDIVPANQLRMYIEFSAPMGQRPGLQHVSLLDDKGRQVVDPFLPVDGELWNADHTRFTVFFDPGRQKRGILPNREMGESLIAGRKYTLRVSRDWLDGNGQPLRETFERRFTVGPPDRSPLTVASWKITPPREGTREPLTVAFSEALDHGLLLRAIGVRRDGAALTGQVQVDANETRWTMTPGAPWQPGRYELIALGILEDLAGNRIGRAFEIVGAGDKGEDDAAVTSIAFNLASPSG